MHGGRRNCGWRGKARAANYRIEKRTLGGMLVIFNDDVNEIGQSMAQ